MRLTFVAAAALAALSSAPATAHAQAASATATVTCQVTDVSVFGDRVHVRCVEGNLVGAYLATTAGQSATYSPFAFFAVPTSSPLAGVVATLATSARASSKPLQITYQVQASSNPAGCAASDCRRILTARLIY